MTELQRPVPLARLPNPLKEDGKTRFNIVYSVSGTRKRKRHEICAAVDGDSVNIYNVQRGNLLSSYVVPPTTSFSCTPCSIHYKTAGDFARDTYVAAAHGAAYSVKRFHERTGSGGISKNVSDTLVLKDSKSRVFHVSSVPSDGSLTPGDQEKHDVIIVHEDGQVRRLSPSLTQKWHTKVFAESCTTGISIFAAEIIDMDQAKQSLLKNRGDLMVGLNADSPLLMLVFGPAEGTTTEVSAQSIGLWSLSWGLETINMERPSLRPILSHRLPFSEVWASDRNAEVTFAPASAVLSAGFVHGLITYDVSTYAPRVITKAVFTGRLFSSSMWLNPLLFATASQQWVTIYDGNYQAVQASVNTQQQLKRKRTSSSRPHGPVRFVAFFSQLDVLLALQRNHLVSLDLRNVLAKAKGKGSRNSGLLIDSIGRGIHAPGLNAFETKVEEPAQLDFGRIETASSARSRNWSWMRSHLDDLANARDVVSFEAMMKGELTSLDSGPMTQPSDKADRPAVWQEYDYAKSKYVISRIFRCYQASEEQNERVPSVSTQLELVLPSRHAIRWLSGCGMLTRDELSRALARIGEASSGHLRLQAGAVAHALIEADPRLELLSDYLKEPHNLDIADATATAMMLLALVARGMEQRPSQNVLHSAPIHLPQLDGGDPVVMEESSKESNRTLVLQAASDGDESLAYSRAANALVRALTVLGRFSSSSVSAQLRSALQQEEVLALVQFLRQQLFRGGHIDSIYRAESNGATSSIYTESAGTDVKVDGNSLSLDTNVQILSACIDSIGPIGLLATHSDDDFIEHVIPDLKSEISRTTEAIEEACYLQGLLRETLRYAGSTTKNRIREGGEKERIEEAVKQGKGAISTLYSELSDTQANAGSAAALLPLSFRVENDVISSKIRKGDGKVIGRSSREIQHLRYRSVGPYTFERVSL